jgi:hypothetical protein
MFIKVSEKRKTGGQKCGQSVAEGFVLQDRNVAERRSDRCDAITTKRCGKKNKVYEGRTNSPINIR